MQLPKEEKAQVDYFLKKFQLNAPKHIKKITHEDAISSSVYLLEFKNFEKMILKIPFNEKKFKKETHFLHLLKNKFSVPEIFDSISPTHNQVGAILMQFIEGNIIKAKDLNEKQSFEMGKLLAKLHSIKVSSYKDVLSSKCEKDGLCILRNYFEESFQECQEVLSQELLTKIRKYFEQQTKNIHPLDGPCLVHSDFRPGNILMKENKICGLLDFENAKYSFAEEDFAQMDVLVWKKYPKTKEAFKQGYSILRKLPDFDKILPLLRVCKALGAIGFTIMRNTYQNKHRDIFKENLYFIKSFLKK